MVTVQRISADDAEAIGAYVDVHDAARALDSPWVPSKTPFRVEMDVRHGWDGPPARYYLVRDGDTVTGYGWLETFVWDNPDLAWIHVAIRPEQRRRGHGTAAVELLLDECRRLGRTLIGIGPWDAPGPRAFAAAMGFEPKAESEARRQSLRALPSGLIDDLYVEAAERAGDYELSRLEGRLPDDLIDEFALMAASINDAPIDDLELEDDAYTPERLRAFERSHHASRLRVLRVLARHRPTAELAGHTVVVVDEERPAYAAQEDTAVARPHRGHRLGLLLKAEMCRWLLEAEPKVEHIDTWNTASNDQMVRVNDRLGYQVVGRSVEYQRRLCAP